MVKNFDLIVNEDDLQSIDLGDQPKPNLLESLEA